MKGLYCYVLFFATITTSWGQTAGQFRSFQTGSWNSVNTWERFDGATWINPAPSTPTNADGPIAIQNGHTVTVTSNVSIDQTTIQTGGAVIVNDAVTLTIVNASASTGNELTISSGSMLTINGTTGALTINNGTLGNFCTVSVSGVINNAGNINFGGSLSRLTFNANSVYDHRHTITTGAIPRGTTASVVTWDPVSTCQVTGYTSNPNVPSGLNQTFGNFVWNTPNLNAGGSAFDLNGQLTDVNGNLTIQSMGIGGDVLYFSISTPYALNVDGNLSVDDGVVAFANDGGADATLNVLGDFTINGGSVYMSGDAANVTINAGGNFDVLGGDLEFMLGAGTVSLNASGNVSFNGNSINSSGGATNVLFGNAAVHQFTNTVTTVQNINFTVENGSTLNINPGFYLMGNGNFTLQAGATLGVGSVNGLVKGNTNGNIRVSGTRTYAANSNIIYNGTLPQNLGNEWGTTGALNGIAVNLEIANSNSAGVTNNIIGSTSLVGNLTLTSNSLNIGNANTLIIQSNFISNGGTIGGLSTSNLTFSGSGTISGTLNFVAGGQNLNNLSISRAATIALGTPLVIDGALSFTEAGVLQFNGQTLTINGDITQTGGGVSGGLQGDSGSNLIIAGTGPLSTLRFVNSSQLNNLTLGRTTGGTYTIGSTVTVNGTLALNAGTLTHSSGLIMGNGSTFLRKGGASISTNPPNASGSYNVDYSGDLMTGLELPTSTSALNNLTVAGNVTLDKPVTINGDVNINSGTFDATTFDIVIAGSDFQVNGGAFTMGSAKTITFSKSGTTSLGGSTISGIHFGNITINPATTVSAPNGTMNVAGTWDNLGTFTANNSTVTFDGGNQNIDGNGQPFYNVTFGGTGTKVLQGALDVNNILTISSTLDAGANQTINVAGSWVNNGTFLAQSGTVIFDGAAQNINSNNQAFYNLSLSNSGTKTLQTAINVDGALSIANGVTLDVSTSNYAVSVAGNWINDGTFQRRLGTVTFDGNTTISGSTQTNFNNVTIAGILTASAGTSIVLGNWLHSSGSFNSNNGTLQFSGGNQSITPGGQSFSNIIIGGTNTKTLLGSMDINGNLSLNAGTFSVGSDRAVTLAGNFDASGGGVLQAQTGTFTFDGAAQNIRSAGESFFNVSFSGTGTKTLQDAFDANGIMDINVALAAGSNDIHVGGDWDATGGSFTTSGTTTFDGAAQNILSNGSSFGSLVLAGSGTKLLHSALDANGSLTLTSTLDVNTSNFAINVGGNWDTSTGTFTSRSGLVTLDGNTQSLALGAANSFNSLTLAGTGTKTQLDAIDVNANLLINSGAVLDAADNDLTLAGNITTNGSYLPGASTLTLNGGGGQSLAGTTATNYNNITVNKASGTAIVSTAQNLINTLTLTSGTLNANSMLTLVSSATGDARIAEITGGAITGEIIAQRYMHITASLPNGGVYRYLSSPVTDAFVSDLKDDFPVTGTFNDPSTQGEWPGLNVTSTARIMFLYNEAHLPTSTTEDRYESYPFAGTNSSAAPLENGRGYSARIRQTTPIVIDFPGTPQTGDVPVNVTAQSNGGNDGWNLIGNPYPAPISWDKVSRPAGVNAQIALKDNANNSGIGEGQYVYYTQGSPGVGIPASYDGYIPSGQAFWVRATSNATITFQENDKQDISNPSFMRVAPVADVLRINVSGNNRMDELVIQFKEGATDGADQNYDAFKLKNDFINFSSLSADSVKMAINVLGGVSCNKEVGLVLDNVSPGSYALNFSQYESFNSNIHLRLLDSFTGVVLDINDQNAVYRFSVTDNPNSFGNKRFKVYAGYPEVQTALAFQGEDVCIGTNARISIQDTQEGVKYFPTINGNTVGGEVVSEGGVVELFVNADKLAEGENTVVLMASIAGCTAVPLDNSAMVNQEAIYAIKSATGGKTCGEGQVSLSAEGAPSDGFYRWYEAVDSQTPIAGETTSTFITPVLNKTKTYFVSAVNALGCEGERVEVVADVSLFESVSISVSEGTLTSSYDTGNQWYMDGEAIPGATGQTIEVTETGLYEVEAKLAGGCTTRASQEMIVMGIEDPLGQGYSFYPNPVETELNIALPNANDASGYIQSAQGKKLGNLRFSASGGKMTAAYNFENESAGLYIVRIFQGNRILNYKIIKR